MIAQALKTLRPALAPRSLIADARHFQIITLGSLLTLLVLFSDFVPDIGTIALTMGTAIWAQILAVHLINERTSLRAAGEAIQKTTELDCRVAGAPRNDTIPLDLRSPFITSLSLCLLFRAGEIWFFPLAALIAIGSKFLIRYDGKHVFNPANIAIVSLLLLFPNHVWVSPGQWGANALIAFALICFSFLVLYRVDKRDVVLFFIGCFAALTFGRALWLGDPLVIPWHTLQNGSLLVFTFFMMSDPKTTPNHVVGRFLFALCIAVIGFIMTTQLQIREGLFYALAMVCMVTPIIDRYWPARQFEWTNTNRTDGQTT